MPERKNTYAVIGDPVEHSLSPLIHNYIYQLLDLPYSYQKMKVGEKELKKFINKCRKDNIAGFNVTIPHKVTIIPFLDEIDKQAELTGAVNTVKKENSVLKGFNTDVSGCVYALQRSSWEQTGKVVILGAGGACRAALVALTTFSPNSVYIFNRSLQKAVELKQKFFDKVKFDIYAENIKFQNTEKQFSDTSLLINTTPVGMWPDKQVSPVPDPDMIPEHTTVFDMVPNPVYTKLLEQAKLKGVEIISGVSMLISQAISAQEIWLKQKLHGQLFDTIWRYVTKNMSIQNE